MEQTKYLHELEIYDGEAFIVFNIISLSVKKGEIVLALTNRGKITVVTYDLRSDEKGLYGHGNTPPSEEAKTFIEGKWLPYAKRKLRKIAA